jgi:hypothetical protein
MRRPARPGAPAAAAAPGTSPPAVGHRTGPRFTAAILLAAAALDLTRCGLALMTSRHIASNVGLVTAGIGAAVVSMAAARGYRAGQRWAVWAALVIGVASAPQASASGFRAPFTIPDAATAVLGVLLTVAVLAFYGRPVKASDHSELPWDMDSRVCGVVGGAVGRNIQDGAERQAGRRNPPIGLDRLPERRCGRAARPMPGRCAPVTRAIGHEGLSQYPYPPPPVPELAEDLGAGT